MTRTPEQAAQPGDTVYRVLADLLSYAEQNVCTHENTRRGGAIWEVCDDCGAQWADDQGGKPEFEWPKAISAARAVFNEMETAPAQPAGNAEQADETKGMSASASVLSWMEEHDVVLSNETFNALTRLVAALPCAEQADEAVTDETTVAAFKVAGFHIEYTASKEEYRVQGWLPNARTLLAARAKDSK